MDSIPSAATVPTSVRIPIQRFLDRKANSLEDIVIVEEPMELQVTQGKGSERTLAITMRTPGNDFELAIGFLIGEGVVHDAGDVLGVKYCGPASPDKGYQNVVQVELAESVAIELERLERNFYMTSSCGVCGKSSIEAVNVPINRESTNAFQISTDALAALPEKLVSWQTDFKRTGGLHAAATVDNEGNILRVREDVGRHNAVDKLIGSYFAEDQIDLTTLGLLLSGRAGFELVQKAAVAGMGFVAAIGPPSNLAIELAVENNITLVGFLKETSFNIYNSNGNSVRE